MTIYINSLYKYTYTYIYARMIIAFQSLRQVLCCLYVTDFTAILSIFDHGQQDSCTNWTETDGFISHFKVLLQVCVSTLF